MKFSIHMYTTIPFLGAASVTWLHQVRKLRCPALAVQQIEYTRLDGNIGQGSDGICLTCSSTRYKNMCYIYRDTLARGKSHLIKYT
jgi:hypothetical protein